MFLIFCSNSCHSDAPVCQHKCAELFILAGKPQEHDTLPGSSLHIFLCVWHCKLSSDCIHKYRTFTVCLLPWSHRSYKTHLFTHFMGLFCHSFHCTIRNFKVSGSSDQLCSPLKQPDKTLIQTTVLQNSLCPI